MRMQKFTSLLLACLIMVFSSGFAFNVHYCGDKIASVSLGTEPVEECIEPVTQKACCAQASKDHQSCCSDKVVEMQDQPDVVVKSIDFSVDSVYVVTQAHPLVGVPQEFPLREKNRTYRYAPNAPPLFKLYRQLIFYA